MCRRASSQQVLPSCQSYCGDRGTPLGAPSSLSVEPNLLSALLRLQEEVCQGRGRGGIEIGARSVVRDVAAVRD
jgi:hypothetical protein